MDLTLPFRGAEAIAVGAVTRGRLAGPRFRHLGHGVYISAGTPDSLAIRARAAALSVPGAVVGGYAAAELLDASCGPLDATVELVVGRRRLRARPGVTLRQDVLAPGETMETEGVPVTTPLRTAWDLARRLPRVEAIVAVDALAHVWGFDPAVLLGHPRNRLNPSGTRQLTRVLAEADPRAESPPETRTRLLLADAGLRPVPQHTVLDGRGRFVARLDLAWPAWKVALEYQGDGHRLDRARYAADTRRFARLAAEGWLVLPVTTEDLRDPLALLARVQRALATRRAAA